MIAPKIFDPDRLGVGPEEGRVAPRLDEREGGRREHHRAEADDHRPQRPHRDQPAVQRGHQQGQRIAGRGQQQRMDDEHRAHRIGEARQRAEDEIAAPADRLEHPEGAVLVVEEGPVEPDALQGSAAPAPCGASATARPGAAASASARTLSLAMLRLVRRDTVASARYRPARREAPRLGVAPPTGLGCDRKERRR